MRIIKWMRDHTILDKIRNEVTREKVEVTPIADKIRESRLRWFGHIKRRDINTPLHRCERIDISNSNRVRGRPKKN